MQAKELKHLQFENSNYNRHFKTHVTTIEFIENAKIGA